MVTHPLVLPPPPQARSLSAGADPATLFADGVQAFKAAAPFAAWSLVATCLFADMIAGVGALRRRSFVGSGHERPIRRRSGLAAFYDAHPLLSTALTLLVCWLPFYVGFAPGILMGDTPYTALPWFGLGPFSDWMEPIDPNVSVPQQHPGIPCRVRQAGPCHVRKRRRPAPASPRRGRHSTPTCARHAAPAGRALRYGAHSAGR